MNTKFQIQKNEITGEAEVIEVQVSDEHAKLLAARGVEFLMPSHKSVRELVAGKAKREDAAAAEDAELRAWAKSSKAPNVVLIRLGVSV